MALDAIGEAGDGQELLAKLEQLRPDIILLDRDLPGWPPANLSDAFRGLDRRPKMIVLGAHPETVQTAGAGGADAFVSKGDPPKRLLSAILALSSEGSREW